MPKMISKKCMLLFVGVVAALAFAMPATASAVAWDVVGTTHVLDGSNPGNRFSFSVAAVGIQSVCDVAQLHTFVNSASDMVVTAAVFKSCTGRGAAVNCTVTTVATRVPWTVTNPSTTDVRIDRVHIDALFENIPSVPTACALPGNITLTGTLLNGTWNQPQHEINLSGATGLTAHIAALGLSAVATVTGTLRDPGQALTLTD